MRHLWDPKSKFEALGINSRPKRMIGQARRQKEHVDNLCSRFGNLPNLDNFCTTKGWLCEIL